jgi:hypothetical protein
MIHTKHFSLKGSEEKVKWLTGFLDNSDDLCQTLFLEGKRSEGEMEQ